MVRRSAAVAALALTLLHPAHAQNAVPPAAPVRVGQPQAGTFQFVPLQVGIAAGIFKQHGVDVEAISFAGGPRVQQALTAGSVDIAIGSGPELAFVVKGVPEIGIAAMADAPYSVVLATLKDSPIRTAEDLKGKKVSISSRRSLTDWLGQELSRQLGFGPDGIALVPLGTTGAQMAALKTHQIDGMIVEANAGYRMEEEGSGRVVVQFGDRIKVFHIYVLYARRDFAAQRADAVRAFLAGWFDSVAHMRAHREETIDIVRRTADVSPRVAARDYDELMGMFNSTGRFDPKALDVLARSFVEMGLLPQAPDMHSLVTEEFLPGRP
jgi:ABC-type nitrate/sulfonate/bicarbonate transport system substrate-binding protein